jgi:hypothetical protein
MSVNKRQADGTLLPIAGLGSYDLNNLKQYATLPTPTSTNEGQVVQYIGNDSAFSVGGMYQCQEDSGSYSWVLLSQSIVVDDELSTTSENPVQNKVINTALADKVDASDLGTAAYKDVPESGDASTTEVVMGNDSRLTDSRNAKDVSAWAKASTKPTYTASEVGAIATTAKGSASGVAELDANGKVPSSQLPSYVDDIVEGYYKESDGKFYKESTYTTEITGESGKIYLSLDTEIPYRWSGSAFVAIPWGLALGETSTTAYRGDRGKTAYDFSQDPYTSNPAEDGTASAGSSTKWAKGDHVHPHDSTKVDKVTGKGLSTNDFTDALKTKLDGITVNNATLTIQKNGTTVKTFTANASTDVTADITVPTKVSELTNDSGYTTNTGTVTSVKVGSTSYNPTSGVVSLPAYPTVNNATLTIQKNGTNVQTFTANQSSNATCNITMNTTDVGIFNGTSAAWAALSAADKAKYTIVILTDD